MQLGILIEEMRREGYEMSLSPPSVVMQQGAASESSHRATGAIGVYKET